MAEAEGGSEQDDVSFLRTVSIRSFNMIFMNIFKMKSTMSDIECRMHV